MANIANTLRNITTVDEIANFDHGDLKQIKKGQVNSLFLGGRKFTVTWNEEDQRFDSREQKSFFASVYDKCCCCGPRQGTLLAANIATALNQSERADKLDRSAERYNPIGGQLHDLMMNLQNANPQNASQVGWRIMQTHEERELRPLQASNTASIAASPNPPRILVYGLANNRQRFVDHAVDHFKLHERAVIETIDGYNECLGIDPNLNFQSYCALYQQMVQPQQLQLGIKSTATTEYPVGRMALLRGATLGSTHPNAQPSNQQQIKGWANYLEAHANQFDFSRKLGNSDDSIEALRFIIKNCMSQNLEFLNDSNNPRLTEIIRGDQYTLNEPSMHYLSERLKGVVKCIRSRSQTDYQHLTTDEKTLVDTVVRNAFFRQTSKLGLSYAKESGVMVLFVWKGDEHSGVNDLTALRKNLNAKPYKFAQPGSREYGLHEFITYSEMRQLGRLLARVEGNNSHAPDYLLVSGEISV